MLVMQLMSHPVTVCFVGDNLSQAARLLADRDRGALSVVDERGRAVAMLTDRDICLAAYRHGKPLAELSVRETMSPRLYTCRPDEPLAVAEQVMRQHQVRRLPVLDGQGRPVGMLALNDLARAAVGRHPLWHGIATAGSRIIATARTWASIGTPRPEPAPPAAPLPAPTLTPMPQPTEVQGLRWEWHSYGRMACGGPVSGGLRK